MSTPSIIENKKKEKGHQKKEGEKSNWGKFGISILNNFILTAFISVLGSNFIFFSTLNNLEYFLPTKKSAYFDETKSRMSDKLQQFRNSKLPKSTTDGVQLNLNKEVNEKLLNKLGIGDIHGWPYDLYKKQLIPSISQGFKNWFSTSTAETYMTQRKALQSLIGFFSPEIKDNEDKNLFSSQPLQIILAPFITLFGTLLVPLVAFFVTFIKLFTNKHGGFIYSFIGLFLIYTWVIPYAVSTLQTIQYILTLMFIPLLSNYKDVLKTIYSNGGFLGFLFGALVVMSAFKNLELVFGLVSLAVYIILLISYIFKK